MPVQADNVPPLGEVSKKTALGDYRLAPGDRLTVRVFDQEKISGDFLSGDFFVDGSGGILLPIAGTVRVAGLTVLEAQKLIQDRLADGILVEPTVSVRIPEFRPIFVTGHVKKPGSYQFTLGQTVKAAIATAGGEGQATEQLQSVVVSDFIMAEERVRQLETNRLGLRVRKARLEAQRDEEGHFIVPELVGFNSDSADFQMIYAAENDAFSRLSKAYHDQLQTLEQQRPRIEEEIKALTEQIATEKDRLEIVTERLEELEHFYTRGFIRKEVLIKQRIEKALVQGELSRLEAQVAHSRQTMGDLDVKIGEVKANYKRQTLVDLQEASQRLREIEAIIGMARKIRDIKAEYTTISGDEPDYTILISRTSESGTETFNAATDTLLQPGDVVEVKLRRNSSRLWRHAEHLLQIKDRLLKKQESDASSVEGLTIGSNP